MQAIASLTTATMIRAVSHSVAAGASVIESDGWLAAAPNKGGHRAGRGCDMRVPLPAQKPDANGPPNAPLTREPPVARSPSQGSNSKKTTAPYFAGPIV